MPQRLESDITAESFDQNNCTLQGPQESQQTKYLDHRARRKKAAWVNMPYKSCKAQQHNRDPAQQAVTGLFKGKTNFSNK